MTRCVDFQDVLEIARFKGFNPIVKTLDDAVQAELKDFPKDKIKIMDAGAGTGLVGIELQKFGFSTIDALDISPGMLEEAKKKNIYKKLICAALNDQQIPEIKTGEYDVLICVGVFAIAHVPPVAIVEMIRMVRAGMWNDLNKLIQVLHFKEKNIRQHSSLMGPFEVTSETGVDWIVSNHALWDSFEDSIASFFGYYKVANRKLGPILSPKKVQ